MTEMQHLGPLSPKEATAAVRELLAKLWADIHAEEWMFMEKRERELSWRPRDEYEDHHQRSRLRQLSDEYHYRTAPIRKQIDYLTQAIVRVEMFTRATFTPPAPPAEPTQP